MVENIRNRKEMEEWYRGNMTYDRKDEEEKRGVVKKYSKRELIYIYEVLYGVRARKYDSKEVIFRDIQRHFDNLERARALFC